MTASGTQSVLRPYRADTHIHTCLSPCADLSMGPKDIVAQSRKVGLDIIAVCDHNTAENAAAVISAGKSAGLTVLAGMEVCSKEEVHVVALFETPAQAIEMQQIVYDHLPGQNRPEVWGEQIVAGKANEVLAENDHLLIGATTLDLYAIVDHIHDLNGLCIASHVDRPAYSLIGNLGFIPPDLAIDAIEVSWRIPVNEAEKQVAGIGGYPCITASDAHFIEDIGRAWTGLELAGPTVAEIRQALSGTAGRRIIRQ
ncbi:MAG: PHP-associated domain-containing protein [Thermodesulfobacteriota bacterium]